MDKKKILTLADTYWVIYSSLIIGFGLGLLVFALMSDDYPGELGWVLIGLTLIQLAWRWRLP